MKLVETSDLHGTNYESTVASYKSQYPNCYIQYWKTQNRV